MIERWDRVTIIAAWPSEKIHQVNRDSYCCFSSVRYSDDRVMLYWKTDDGRRSKTGPNKYWYAANLIHDYKTGERLWKLVKPNPNGYETPYFPERWLKKVEDQGQGGFTCVKELKKAINYCYGTEAFISNMYPDVFATRFREIKEEYEMKPNQTLTYMDIVNGGWTGKYWNGKVVCTKYDWCDTDFTVGKVYTVLEGGLIDNYGEYYLSRPVKSFDDLIALGRQCYNFGNRVDFIEYKGMA